jgi:hypothetical protein
MKRRKKPSTDEDVNKKKKVDDYDIFKQRFEFQW